MNICDGPNATVEHVCDIAMNLLWFYFAASLLGSLLVLGLAGLFYWLAVRRERKR